MTLSDDARATETDLFERFLHTEYVDVLVAGAKGNLFGPSDEAVTVNFLAVRRPDDSAMQDCATGLASWTGIRYFVAEWTSDNQIGTVHVTRGLDPSSLGAYGGGRGIKLVDPATVSNLNYVVSGVYGHTGNEKSTHGYMGLEGNIESTSYGVYDDDRYAVSTRFTGSFTQEAIISNVVFSTESVGVFGGARDTIKFVSFQKNTNSIKANYGVKEVKQLSSGRYSVEWDVPFADSNYVVIGLSNFWCSSGSMLHVDDDKVQTTRKTFLSMTNSAGAYSDYGESCIFVTIVAIGSAA